MADLREQLQTWLGSAYTLERELGGGGMSRVFVAEETALARAVVVKVLPPDMSGALSAQRFRREVQLAAKLHHPHVVPVLQAGEAGELLYYTMPFVEGESLRARLARERELPVPEAIRILRDIADALCYAHERGVVHRDLKPDNVLLSGRHAVVTDFGVAKALSAAGQGSESGSLTSTGVALGTPVYMSPEQAVADPHVDHRTDLYALGVLAYEMLSGAPPFPNRTPQQTLAAHVSEAPEAIERRRAGLPVALAALVMRLLEKRPADRPQSAEEVVRALEAVGAQTGGSAVAPLLTPTTGRFSRRRRVGVTLVAVVALAGSVVVYMATRSHGRTVRDQGTATRPGTAPAGAPAGVASVAILPFVNIGGDTAAQYFADGMTEELIGALSKVEGLRVPGRTSVFALRGKSLDARTIGDTLHVQALLDGSVRRSGDRLRIAAQLVSASDNAVLWSAEYDRQLKDVFAVQDEISRAIVSALRLRLRLADRTDTMLVRRATDDPEAHDLYLRGRFLWNQRTYESLLQAVSYFEQAIRRDSAYAEAYVGLADTYDVVPVYGPARPSEAYSKAKAAALRAIALDSTLAAAHAALGYARMAGDYDWAGAEREVRRAAALDPNYAPAYQRAANYLLAEGRLGEAAAAAERAGALDPLSRVIGADVGTALAMAGRFDEAIRVLHATLELDPNFARAHLAVCDVNLWRREPRQALAACERAATLSGRQLAIGPLSYAYAAAGERVKAAALLRELEDRRRRSYVRATELAVASLGLGDTDGAFAWLDSAVAEHDPNLNYLRSPLWTPLRADPRFTRLMRRMGLAP